MTRNSVKHEWWRTIKGFPNYEVSTYGNVRAKRKTVAPRLKQRCIDRTGCTSESVLLHRKEGGKRVRRYVRVAELVVAAFHVDQPTEGKRPRFEYVDGNPVNCRRENIVVVANDTPPPHVSKRRERLAFRVRKCQRLLAEISDYSPTMSDRRLSEITTMSRDSIIRLRRGHDRNGNPKSQINDATYQKIAKAHALIVKGQVITGHVPLVPSLRAVA